MARAAVDDPGAFGVCPRPEHATELVGFGHLPGHWDGLFPSVHSTFTHGLVCDMVATLSLVCHQAGRPQRLKATGVCQEVPILAPTGSAVSEHRPREAGGEEAEAFPHRRFTDEAVLRERDAEIRQLLRWKEAELRQLQQQLHRERDCAVRQARDLQRQLADELLNRGYGGRQSGGSSGGGSSSGNGSGGAFTSSIAGGGGAAQCRCRLQDVLAKLRWETDGEQAARIRHLQAALDVERSLFLKYILENFHWDPAAVLSAPPGRSQNRPATTEPALAMAIISGAATPALEGAGELPPGLSSRAAVTASAAAPAPTLAERVRTSTLPSRPRSLDSLCPPRPRATALCLDNTSRSLDGSPGRAQSPPGAGEPEDRARLQLGGGEKGPEPEGAPSTLPSPRPTAYSELVKQNSELAEALDTLARHCSGLRQENCQLRRGLPEADEKVQRLKLKNVELAGIAKRLEERARKLHETNLRTPTAAPAPAAAGRASQGQSPGPAAGNPSRSALELCRQAFARQRAKDLTEQTSALQAKDKQIEDLRQECRDLQARVAACQSTAGQGSTQWLNVNDFDHLLRESQKEVLRLQRQVTLQKCFKGPHTSRASSPRAQPQSPRREGEDKEDREEEEEKKAAQEAQQAQQAQEAQELKLRLHALEEKLSERQKCCESLQLDVGKVQQRLQEAEGRLQRLTTENNRLAQENGRFQEKVQWAEKVDSENNDMRGRLELVTRERDAGTLQTVQLQQQVGQVEASRQLLEKELQEAVVTLAAQQEEVQKLLRDQELQQREHEEAVHTLQAQIRELERPSPQKAKELRRSQLPRSKWAKKVPRPPEGPSLPDAAPAGQRASTQTSASNAGPGPLGLLASPPTPQALPAGAAPAGSDQAPEPESPATDSQPGQDSHDPSKLKIFLARYSYDPYAGPNEQPEAELALTAGEYIYVFGDMDEDGFYSGELMNGQRGLVPSNLVEQISDSEILNFHVPEGSDLSLDSSQEMKPLGGGGCGGGGESASPEGRGTDYPEDASCCDLLPKTLEKSAEEEEEEEAWDFSGVPCPQKLTLLQQLPRAVVVGWERPRGNHPYGAMQGYNIYVDRELWQNIRASNQKQVTVEELDLKTRAYRISVQSVMERGCSNPLACSFLVGQDFCLAPTRLRLKSLSPTSAEISWLYSNSNYPHMVRLNEQEHSLAEAGVCRYIFPDLQPSSRYCVHVEVRPPGEASGKPWREMASSIAFTTPLAGPPDPPLDVLVECHSSPGTLLVSWIPVTIDSAGSSNGVPVTGYAVYADGQKVTEVASPTAGNVLVELSQIQRQKLFQEVSVRTTSHYGESLDSVPAQIPGEWCKQASAYPSPQAFPVNHNCGDPAHPHIPAPSRLPVPTGQEKSVASSFNTKASSPLSAGCGRPKAAAWDGLPEDGCKRRSPKPSDGELPSPRDAGTPPGPGEARTPSPLASGRKDAHGSKAGKDSKVWSPRHVPDGQPAGEEKSARNAVPRAGRGKESLTSPPPESGQGKESPRENHSAALGGGRAPRNSPEAETPKGSGSQSSEAQAAAGSPEEEDQYVTAWGARTAGPKKEIRLGRGPSRPAGRKKEAPPQAPTQPPRPLLYQAPSEKVTKILKAGPVGPGAALWFRAPESGALKGNPADYPVRVFVALWDYDPQVMSANHAAAQEELTFHRGQILKVWGDRDPDGFYRGECSGRTGYIPGNLVSEVQVEGSDVLKQLLQQGHLPSEVSLDGIVGLPTQPPGPQKSFSVARGGPRRAQLWHPQTMVAAFDYQPRKSSSLSVTEELTLSAGDVVTVLGSVDDNGFLYGELNGQRGLVPWNLLKTPALNGAE
ncbi:RIMS-binding protein 3-like [Gracilinanus agilis]|uniref:RIMS-binding protein 3-like n=1 Tax=Gracilinanus agilis TaxID=191870 RepID=UPI001CFDF2DF|nr:RIMS-binding protein 3-like [Gracilinanus agilis]